MEFLHKQEYNLSYLQENVELVIYSALCLFVPFFVGHPQFLVGTIVNAALILAALNLKTYKILPIIILPSIGVFSRNLIFGNFTMFLLYMVPFIWIGNAILVYSFKKLFLQKKMNKGMTLLLGAVSKSIFLFLAAFILVKLNILPAVFLAAMGITQFYTAMTGGFLALGTQMIKKRYA